MKTINFVSLHGTPLSGQVFDERKFRNNRVFFIRMLGKIYAVNNGVSIDEVDADTDMSELERRIKIELQP